MRLIYRGLYIALFIVGFLFAGFLMASCASMPVSQDDDPIIVQRSDYSLDMVYKYTIQIRLRRPVFPRCDLPDAGNEIMCRFSYEYLKTGAMISGGEGWATLSAPGARAICIEAMHPTLIGIATNHDVNTCGFILQYIRFRDLAPENEKNDG